MIGGRAGGIEKLTVKAGLLESPVSATVSRLRHLLWGWASCYPL